MNASDLPSSVRRLLGSLVDASVRERIAISVAALFASLLVGAVVIMAAGLVATCKEPFLALGGSSFCYDPWEVYYQLFVSPFLNDFNTALMLKETTLLLFTGLAVAVAFRAGLFNIGAQGQLVFGALGSALAVLWGAAFVPTGVVGSLVLIPFGLVVGAVVGGLYGAVPGLLKAYADANEVITTIMLNFVATNVAFYLVSTYFKDPASQSVETKSVPAVAQLKPVLGRFESTSFSVWALLTGLALVVVIYYLLFHTSFGYDMRISGIQPAAAAYGGVDAERLVVGSMVLSGALSGLAGAVYVLMVLGRWRTGIPAVGFDGITVSILASNNPLGVVPAAFLFGILKSGSLSISFALGVPKQLVGVLRGLIILFVAMPEFFRMVGLKLGVGDRQPVATDGGRPVEGGDDDE
ncbi:ABC transporter permease [Haloarculaceae archaeon H-GB2-1]|nr:ABC transporter permease [Haloarculaceae archaeon H-GB1-1]MEA5386564.1 ABC transporter permease [Haloarculaceae archaeon H-GB11]MEA5408077.1 ABC transporter permease [Haloarculaceae archaeon H-GB2-1]